MEGGGGRCRTIKLHYQWHFWVYVISPLGDNNKSVLRGKIKVDIRGEAERRKLRPVTCEKASTELTPQLGPNGQKISTNLPHPWVILKFNSLIFALYFVTRFNSIMILLSMADNDVKAKLEAKKKRLEELKKARINRQKPTPVSILFSCTCYYKIACEWNIFLLQKWYMNVIHVHLCCKYKHSNTPAICWIQPPKFQNYFFNS